MTLSKKLGVAAGAAGVAAAAAAVALAAGATGPSTTTTPYLVPTDPSVGFTSLLTVGDRAGTKPNGDPYVMAGIPDGLGAFKNRDGRTFTVLMNHELGNTAGIARAHGGKGAFVSRWTVDRRTLAVTKGEDLIKRVFLWNTAGGEYVETPGVTFSRFCSADLGPEDAYHNARTRRGYDGRIYMNGEESGVEGRAFAHLLNGDTYELPALGRFSWENSVVQPGTGDRTVVIGTDDGLNGQVYVYVGTKQRTGNPVERAGLTNGTLYGIAVAGLTDEANTSVIAPGTAFSLVPLGDATGLTGAQLDAASEAAGVTSFQRPEDASFNPENRRQLVLATTASFTGNSRVWSLRFANGSNPVAGGTLEVLTNTATSGMRMADNLTVGEDGEVIIQEDIGNQAALGKVWRYSLKTRAMTQIAEFDAARFAVPTAPFSQDEESSGVIPAPFLGKGVYLLDVQAHSPTGDAETVEGGQLLAMRLAPPRRGDDR